MNGNLCIGLSPSAYVFAETDLCRSRPILSRRGKNGSSALPQCLRRVCFATTRRRRGCGSGAAPASATGSGLRLIQRKATRGRVLWTPLEGGESRGGTGVAAKAVRRGLEPRIPLTLKRTSDRDFSPPLPTARGLRSRQHCGRRGDSPWTLYQTRTEFDIRAYDLTRCTTLSAFGAFSFFHRARRCLSFRQDEKKDRGAHCAGQIL